MTGRERPGKRGLRATPSFGRGKVATWPRPKDGVAAGPSAGSFTARLLLLFLLAILPARATSPGFTTVFELRVVNAKGGPVQVRLAGDEPWVTLGRVTRPATRTTAGFGASRWADQGSVAATAIHGLRLKVGTGEFPPMVSLVPRQFDKTPSFYGGHIPGDAGIQTDIGAGESVFRDWAPLASSPVRIETAGGLLPLPANYRPAPGDVLRIDAIWPNRAPRAVVFENHKGGAVTAVARDGDEARIGTVAQPLLGVGRFDGTSYTGVGAINTNHPGVITVSTAPVVKTERSEGAPPERRGGFEIQPSLHAAEQARGVPQVLAVAPLEGQPGWEGRFPLFRGAIGLLYDPRDLSGSFHAEMQVDNGPWEPFPTMVGRDDNAFTAKGLPKYLKDGRSLEHGLTAIRIWLPTWDATAARARLEAARKATPPATPEPTGDYRLAKGATPVSLPAARSTTILVDGSLRAAGNSLGSTWTWNTAREKNGRHWLAVESHHADGATTTTLHRFLVQNKE